jgi:hypothetical protein
MKFRPLVGIMAVAVLLTASGRSQAVTFGPSTGPQPVTAADQRNPGTYLSGTALVASAVTSYNGTPGMGESGTANVTINQSVYQNVSGSRTILAYQIVNSSNVTLHRFTVGGYAQTNGQMFYSAPNSATDPMPNRVRLTPAGTIRVDFQEGDPGPPVLGEQGIRPGQTVTIYLEYGNIGFKFDSTAPIAVQNGGPYVRNGAFVPTPEPGTLLAAAIAGIPLVGGAAFRRWRSKKAAPSA